jgi:hypothetical protein
VPFAGTGSSNRPLTIPVPKDAMEANAAAMNRGAFILRG